MINSRLVLGWLVFDDVVLSAKSDTESNKADLPIGILLAKASTVPSVATVRIQCPRIMVSEYFDLLMLRPRQITRR